MSEDKLREHLDRGRDWGKLKTSVPGVHVMRLPAYRSYPSRLAVEVNPLDASGSPTKRRGLVIRSAAELERFREVLNDERLRRLLSLVDSVNPRAERQEQEEMLEI